LRKSPGKSRFASLESAKAFLGFVGWLVGVGMPGDDPDAGPGQANQGMIKLGYATKEQFPDN
jgi:hypothetical protein